MSNHFFGIVNNGAKSPTEITAGMAPQCTERSACRGEAGQLRTGACSGTGQCQDNARTMPGQCQDNARTMLRTMPGQCQDNARTMSGQCQDNVRTLCNHKT